MPVKQTQRTIHGVLLLMSTDGKVIAMGDQVNVVQGNQVRSRLSFSSVMCRLMMKSLSLGRSNVSVDRRPPYPERVILPRTVDLGANCSDWEG
jgi:hypothetical protein